MHRRDRAAPRANPRIERNATENASGRAGFRSELLRRARNRKTLCIGLLATLSAAEEQRHAAQGPTAVYCGYGFEDIRGAAKRNEFMCGR